MNQETINRIEKEANDYLIKLQVSSASIAPLRDRDRSFGYIAGATAEAARCEILVKALEKAIGLIKEWHNMPGCVQGWPQDKMNEIWETYYNHAPEMKSIREALSQYNHPF